MIGYDRICLHVFGCAARAWRPRKAEGNSGHGPQDSGAPQPLQERERFYGDERVTDQLPKLTWTMVQQDKKPPKLRGSAGCIRVLVPFGNQMCQEFLSAADDDRR